MTIYKKPDLKVFGVNAKPTEIAEFEDLLRGWGITIEKTNGIPPMEWFNYLFNRLDGNINYILQNGITEYDTNLEYPQNAVVKSGGKLYLCLRQNTNKPLSNGAYWELLIKNATTSQSGIAQLSSSVTSTDETKASTPKATKVAYDKATQADNNASSKFTYSKNALSSLADLKTATDGIYRVQAGANFDFPTQYGHVIIHSDLSSKDKVNQNQVWRTYLYFPTNSSQFYTAYSLNGLPVSEFKRVAIDNDRIGAIECFASDKSKNGYLKCDGGLYSTTTYAELFKEIGYTWGGNGNKFAVPNLTDKARFLRSSGNGLNVGSYQNDAIRNIVGAILGTFLSNDKIDTAGAISAEKGTHKKPMFNYEVGGASVSIDASRVVPTSSENRPYSAVVAYWIKY